MPRVVDFLTTTIAELVPEVGREVDGNIVKSILEINQMLQIMREDLAMVDGACNRAIVAQVQELISALRIRSEQWNLAMANP